MVTRHLPAALLLFATLMLPGLTAGEAVAQPGIGPPDLARLAARETVQSKGGADQPVLRTDANSKLAHQQMAENLNKGRIDVYFAGDSITRRWRATDYPPFLANWWRRGRGRYSGTGNRKGRPHARLPYTTAPRLDSTTFPATIMPQSSSTARARRL
jgi:hypothetical protein